MAEVVARVGSWSARLGSPALLQSLVATLSYRLEPEGLGSRFPALLTEALAGHLAAERADEAARELAEVVREAQQVPIRQAIGSLDDRRLLDFSGWPSQQAAGSVYDGFLTPDGQRLLDVLAEAIRQSEAQREPFTVRTAQVRQRLWRGSLLTLGGTAVALYSWLRLPDVLLGWRAWSTPAGTAVHGAPLWAWLAILAVAGAVELAAGIHPPLAQLLERRVVGMRLLAALATGAWLLALWR